MREERQWNKLQTWNIFLKYQFDGLFTLVEVYTILTWERNSNLVYVSLF